MLEKKEYLRKKGVQDLTVIENGGSDVASDFTAPIASGPAQQPCMIFFTSGTTGLPKVGATFGTPGIYIYTDIKAICLQEETSLGR